MEGGNVQVAPVMIGLAVPATLADKLAELFNDTCSNAAELVG
jgi:hypothetical protein